IRALLELQRGWKICGESATGKEAVAQAKRLMPDVAILDVSMPDLSGLEATRQICHAVPKTRILILSMNESEQAVRELLEAGARGYVFKSDVDRDLVLAVQMLSQGEFFFTPKVAEMLVARGYLKPAEKTASGESGPALTARQCQVAALLAAGKTNKEVANALGISVKTVEAHRGSIMRRLDLHSFSELVRYALRNNMIQP
ncbi:MAG: LuxR C-terminal-related transcriptional regulator, partial [Terriglobia bacterium]